MNTVMTYTRTCDIVLKDHICKRGFADPRALYQHIVAKSTNDGHLALMHRTFDPSPFVVYLPPPDLHRHNGILRSIVCHQAPTHLYNVSSLENTFLTSDDLTKSRLDTNDRLIPRDYYRPSRWVHLQPACIAMEDWSL
jgi:hypothetical protein